LSLTGAIVDLATCGFMRIDGWLLPDPSRFVYDEDEGDNEDPYFAGLGDSTEVQERSQLRALKKARRSPKWTESQIPTLLTQLKLLVDQVSAYRAEVPRFDELLQQRREAFQAASSATSTPIPIRQPPPRSSFESSSRSASPPRTSAFDSLTQRLFPELSTPSRSNSPRGRRSQERSSGLSGGYGFATPTTSRNAVPPPQFPMGLETPSRDSSRAFSSSPLREADLAAAKSRGIPASQTAAFAAIDQSILARKVGLPIPKGDSNPIPFPNLRGTTEDVSKDGSVQGTDDGCGDGEGEKVEERKEVSVNHVLTNVIVLQEFLLELAALVQVRAGLFGEVRYV